MDYLVTAVIAAAVAVAFYAGLRAYTRRRISHHDKPVDTD
jgi:hypothetical protein